MKKSIIKNYSGNKIEFKIVEGEVYANANHMANGFGGSKKLENWKNSPNTKRYIEALHNSLKSRELNLIESTEGKNGGTWIHEKLILNFARYLNVEFELWCDEQIATLLRDGKVELQPKQLSPAEFLLQQAQIMVEMEKRVAENEKSIQRLEHNLRRAQTTEHFTVIAYANMKEIKPNHYNSSVVGRKATKICKARDLQIGKVVDSKYGLINTYPEEVLEEIFLEKRIVIDSIEKLKMKPEQAVRWLGI